MNLRQHQLEGTNVTHLRCPKNKEQLKVADMIILHYTGAGNAMSAAQHLAARDTDVSAHLVIGRDGRIIQLLPFCIRAWHAGISNYKGRTNLNNYSIGIELDNAGKLHRRGDRFYSWFNKEYPESEIFVDESGQFPSYWHKYTDEQLQTLIEVCNLIITFYPIRYVLRHSDITNRKLDPGPAFPYQDFLSTLNSLQP